MPVVNSALLQSDVTLKEPSSGARLHELLLLPDIFTGLAAFALLVILRFVVQRFWPCGANRIDQRRGAFASRSHDSNHIRFPAHQRLFLNSDFPRSHSWIMDEKSRRPSSYSISGGNVSPRWKGAHVSFIDEEGNSTGRDAGRDSQDALPKDGLSASARNVSAVAAPRFMMARPPPPPPLTPPELSGSLFNFEDRRRSYSGAIPELDTSFFQQPNPDYMSSTSASTSQPGADSQSPTMPRRRSYTKTLPIGIPSPSSFAPTMLESTELVMSPSSFPPSSPLLPGPPPTFEDVALESGIQEEIEVQGEIISVLDDAGAGWKRHTRVYGGGVCLACAASGSDGHGGFYGDSVRPEEKR